MVRCHGVSPKFLVSPQTCVFEKKIITSIERCFPNREEITFSNPDSRPVRWVLETGEIAASKVFSISQEEGVVESGAECVISAFFNPLAIGRFNAAAKLYIEDPKLEN